MDWWVLAVAVVAVLAGCGSVVGPNDPPETVTPAPVPTATPVDSTAGLAPGVSAGGIDDVDALIRQHIGVATNTSYVWQERYRETGVSEIGTYRMSRSRWVAYEDAGPAYRYRSAQRQVVSGERRYVDLYETYGNGSVGYTMSTRKNSTEPLVRRTNRSTTPADFALPNRPIRHLLVLEDQTVSLVDVGGRAHYEIRGTQDAIPNHGDVDEYEARVVVREDGLIGHLNVTFVTHAYGDPVPIQYRLRFTEDGNMTVDAPDWATETRGDTGGP